MKAGDACLFQKRNKDRKFRFQNAGVSIVRVFLTDCKLKINGQIWQSAVDGSDSFHSKPRTIFGTSAIAVGALIEQGGSKTSAHPVSMNLNHIKTSLHCKFCSGTKSGGDALNLFDGQVGDIRTYLLIEQGTQLVSTPGIYRIIPLRLESD